VRYYSLTIQNSAGQVLQVEKNGLGFTWSNASQGATFSSTFTPYQTGSAQLIGQPNPNALNIEFDVPIAPLHIPQGGSGIRVWGLGLRCLSQASNLNPVNGVFKTFTLRAGMSAGLPLANPAQAGVIATGIVYQAFGNWAGTEQTLDMIVQAGSNSDVPISWNWKRGTTLQSALTQMFRQAFPTYKPNINIAEGLVAPSDQTGIYTNIDAFAQHLYHYTQWLGAQANGADYQGVGLITIGNSIYASDGAGTTAPKTVALAFQDLLGQPTWMEANTILFQTVLRADINYNDRVTFPTGVMIPYVLTSPDAAYPNSPAASKTAFQGTFLVNQDIHHYANFRQADAASWNTTFRASYIPKP
jgi:hypothetical protein